MIINPTPVIVSNIIINSMVEQQRRLQKEKREREHKKKKDETIESLSFRNISKNENIDDFDFAKYIENELKKDPNCFRDP